MNYDYVIVGGGTAGLYACSKLEDHPSKVLFEASDRLGGRVLTERAAGYNLEYGPMRFQLLYHSRLRKLINDLNMPLTPSVRFPQTIEKPEDFDSWRADCKIVVEHARSNGRNGLLALLSYGLQEILKTQWDFSSNELFNERREMNFQILQSYGSYNGQPLWKYRLIDLFERVLCSHAIRYIRDNIRFYNMINLEANALGQICYLLNYLAIYDSQTFTLLGGMEQFIQNITKSIVNHTHLRLGHKLKAIEYMKHKTRLVFETHHGEFVAYAKHLFLCIPPTELKSIPNIPKQMKHSLNYIEPVLLYKIFVVLESPPATELSQEYLTKLKRENICVLKEIYWNYNEEKDTGVLLLFGDSLSKGLWFSLEHNEKQLQQKVREILALIFKTTMQMNIVYCGMHNWNGGIHIWLPGINPQKAVRELAIHKQHSTTMHVCGEAYSIVQGYLESALESVDNALDALEKNRKNRWKKWNCFLSDT